MNITKRFKAELKEAVKMHNKYNDLKTKLETFKDKYRNQLSPDQVICLDTGEQIKRGKENPHKRVLDNDEAMKWFDDAIKKGHLTRDYFNENLSKIQKGRKASVYLKQNAIVK